jgi:hypothetical protein
MLSECKTLLAAALKAMCFPIVSLSHVLIRLGAFTLVWQDKIPRRIRNISTNIKLPRHPNPKMKTVFAFILFSRLSLSGVLAQTLPPSPTASVGCEPHGDHWYDSPFFFFL